MKRIYLHSFIISLFFIYNGCSQKISKGDLVGVKWIGTAWFEVSEVGGSSIATFPRENRVEKCYHRLY